LYEWRTNVASAASDQPGSAGPPTLFDPVPQVDDPRRTAAVTAYRPRHIRSLDGVRGLAVLIVFFFHYGGGTHSGNRALQVFGLVNKGGWAGVVLFFVLSGFLITGILWDSFGDPHWWSKFFARRSLRIFPLYFLALLLVILAAIPAGTVAAAAGRIWIPALFLENFPVLGDLANNIASPLALFHLWSIAVEEQFYLIWPWLLLLTRTRQRAMQLCLATFVLSACFRIVTAYLAPAAWDHSLPSEAGALAAGGWLALRVRGPRFEGLRRYFAPAAFLGLLGFMAAGVAGRQFDGTFEMRVFGVPSITLCFTALIALALQPGWVASLLSVRWLRGLGSISYGFYIAHMLLLNYYVGLANRLAGGREGMLRNLSLFVVAGVCSTCLAWLSFHLFERQFLRLKRYFVPERIAARA
jgi:peptidoglycan/LPS O-acetylase OafA/YrhL